MTAIKEAYHTNMTLAEAEKLVLQTLKQVMEDKINTDTVEICVIKADTKQIEFRSAAQM